MALNTSVEDTLSIWKIYDEAAMEAGYVSGPEQRGYLLRCHVAETEEKALQNAREFLWMQGEFTGLTHPVWAAPSGYLGSWARLALAKQRLRGAKRVWPSFEEQVETSQIGAGTPDPAAGRPTGSRRGAGGSTKEALQAPGRRKAQAACAAGVCERRNATRSGETARCPASTMPGIIVR